MNGNITTYKVAISTILGLLGFAVNFYSVDFVFYSSYRMSFFFGRLFSMLITLSWGWKYGLLSALCGGCRTMWILWLPQSGYGPHWYRRLRLPCGLYGLDGFHAPSITYILEK